MNLTLYTDNINEYQADNTVINYHHESIQQLAEEIAGKAQDNKNGTYDGEYRGTEPLPDKAEKKVLNSKDAKRLILHDLDDSQFASLEVSSFFDDKNIIINSNGNNHYCIGCFGCWLKTPGKCVIKDEYQEMGIKLSKVEELLIISKSTFGSYSSSVKNVLDRSISYVLPFFEIRKGEMHHKERYHKNLVISAIFYGNDITEQEKETARKLVEANAVNLNGTVGQVCFIDSIEDVKEVLL